MSSRRYHNSHPASPTTLARIKVMVNNRDTTRIQKYLDDSRKTAMAGKLTTAAALALMDALRTCPRKSN